MATTTFLSNATVNITQGATTWDVSDQASNISVNLGYDALETTAFTSSGSPAGHTYTGGLKSGEVSMTLYLSYGVGEVEEMLAACVGKTSTLVISPSGTTESSSNPEYTISAFLESTTPINSSIGELATVELSWTVSDWSRDIV